MGSTGKSGSAPHFVQGAAVRLDLATTRAIVVGLGGTNATARMFGVRAPSVSHWLHVGMPQLRLAKLRAIARGREDGAAAVALAAVGINPFGPLELPVVESEAPARAA